MCDHPDAGRMTSDIELKLISILNNDLLFLDINGILCIHDIQIDESLDHLIVVEPRGDLDYAMPSLLPEASNPLIP